MKTRRTQRKCLKPERDDHASRNRTGPTPSTRSGSVLIIVLWVSLGLVSIALYFANSMTFEMRASDNAVAAVEAQQAINGAAQYVMAILARQELPGTIPDLLTYRSEQVQVGTATFWMIGRAVDMGTLDEPVYGLIDEASKLNLNTATLEMLEMLPQMTPELAAAIIDWRDSDQTPSQNGAESDTYMRRNPSYRAKDANFESIDELRLVMGAEFDLLYGEDANMNGALDLNENDATTSLPLDNRDGKLDPGILEYVTVYTKEGMLRSDGTKKINVAGTDQAALRTLLQERFSASRANEILSRVSGGGGPGGGGAGGGAAINSLLQFYIRSGMTTEEFAQIEPEITVSDTAKQGLININTASETVLACIPGIGTDKASTVVAYRRGNVDKLTSVAWLLEAIDQASAIQAAPYVTTHSYQFTADIAAVGHHGRGYQRVKFIFDTSDATPQIRYRQDLSHLGWALGRRNRQALMAQNNTRF